MKVQSIDHALLQRLLPPRDKAAHKGLFGHVLVIGGDQGMPGAAYLAASAAYRVGAGVVTVATHPSHVHGILPQLPECLIYPIVKATDLKSLLSKASVCVVGPGFGETPWAASLCQEVLQTSLPCVVDAGALRWLSHHPKMNVRGNWVLTPHPGEAASLLSLKTSEIEASRNAAMFQLWQKYGGCVILKGSQTLVQSSLDVVHVCDAGNPGMASAGMGDLLSGVVAGLLAQGLTLDQAGLLGVSLHAKAGDDAAAQNGMRGLLAHDLLPFLHRRVNDSFTS